MTQPEQPAKQDPPPPPAPAPVPERKKSRVILARVMIRGESVIFERAKLWPQGPAQTIAAQCSFDVFTVAMAIDSEDTKPADLPNLKRKLVQVQRELELAKVEAATGSSVIEAVVGDMYLIDGDAETGRPATVQVLGRPFGEWAMRRVSITATIPQANCFWENLWPMDEFEEHRLMLAADAEEGEGDEEGEGEDEGEDEDDDEEPTPPVAGGAAP